MTVHIILDLDETCISSADVRHKLPPTNKDLQFFELFYGGVLNFTVYKRPHLDQFLELCFKLGNVSFWSAGEKEYVLDIIDNIVPEKYKERIGLILWREHTMLSRGNANTLKSINWLKQKIPLLDEAFGENIVLIDDLEENVIYNGNYGYKITPFNFSDAAAANDTALQSLSIALQKFSTK